MSFASFLGRRKRLVGSKRGQRLNGLQLSKGSAVARPTLNGLIIKVVKYLDDLFPVSEYRSYNVMIRKNGLRSRGGRKPDPTASISIALGRCELTGLIDGEQWRAQNEKGGGRRRESNLVNDVPQRTRPFDPSGSRCRSNGPPPLVDHGARVGLDLSREAVRSS